MIRCRWLVALLCAALVLTLGVASASANSLSVGETGFAVTGEEAEFVLTEYELLEREYIITCPMTISGSFHSETFAKVTELLLGYVTGAVVDEEACESTFRYWNGSQYVESSAEAVMQVLEESLPWHVTYGWFEGALPAVTAIGLSLVGVRLRVANLPRGAACLFGSTAESPMRYIAAVDNEGEFTTLEGDASSERAPFMEGSESCFMTGLGFASPGLITQEDGRSSLTLTLI